MISTFLPGHGLIIVQSRRFLTENLYSTNLSAPHFRRDEERALGPEAPEAGWFGGWPAGKEAQDAMAALQEHFVDREDSGAAFHATAPVAQNQISEGMLVALLAQVRQDHLRIVADSRASGVPIGKTVWIVPAVHRVDGIAGNLQGLGIAVQIDGSAREDVIDPEGIVIPPRCSLFRIAEDRLSIQLLCWKGAEMIEDVAPLGATFGIDTPGSSLIATRLSKKGRRRPSDMMGLKSGPEPSWMESL